MRVFISGGCKNGKSYYAQRLAKNQEDGGGLYYIATMAPVDLEDKERIVRHQQEREGWGFTTIELEQNIKSILVRCNHKGSFLLDSLTALLGNEMFLPDGRVDMEACERIGDELLEILSRIQNIVVVSDYMYSDAFIYEDLTEVYRKHLATLDTLMARHCDVVLEATYNQIIVHKGEEKLNEFFKKIS